MKHTEPATPQPKWRQWPKRITPHTLLVSVRLGALVVSVVLFCILAWRATSYLLSDQAAEFAPRLSLLSGLSTVALVVITAAYAVITAKTLEHLREERLTLAEPLLYFTLKTARLNPENVLAFCLENFGRGPALHLNGEYKTRSSWANGDILRRTIKNLPGVLPVGEVSVITL